MQKLNFTIPRPSLPCQVIIGKNILTDLPNIVDFFPYSQLILVADEMLKTLANQLKKVLSEVSPPRWCCACGTPRTVKRAREKKVHLFYIKAGEINKTETQADRLLGRILKIKPPLDRQALILVLGGGVVGDLTGYVAARALRGLPFFQIPTTFLAMVDSSLGGKTGVDSDKGLTNMIGLFHLPSAVIMDIKVLETLPEKGWQEGLSELVKHAFLNKKLFDFLSKSSSPRDHTRCEKNKGIGELRKNDQFLIQTLTLSTKVKLSIVAQDFEEKTGQRKVLNLGHTFGRALETASNFSLTHGEAVAIGLHAALKASYYKNLLKKETLNKCLNLLKKFNLLNQPVSLQDRKRANLLRVWPGAAWTPRTVVSGLRETFSEVKELASNSRIFLSAIKNAIKYDKKGILGKPRFVLLKDIGKPEVDCQLEEELIDKVLKEVTSFAHQLKTPPRWPSSAGTPRTVED